MIGDGDAWQNLWNLVAVDRQLAAGCSPFRTKWVWAPEGTSLAAHTLSPIATIPGALLGRLTGFPLAYNILVVVWFGVGGLGMFRLARHLGLRTGPALVAALAFAFFPQRTVRALGHLNLLSSSLIPWALDSTLLLFRSRRSAPAILMLFGAILALALADWYIALTGLIAVGALALHQLRVWRVRRRIFVLRLVCAAACSFLAVSPLVIALLRSDSSRGHVAKWCSTAITSLVIPTRSLMISAITAPLTERNHQSVVEGAGYLGLGALLAMGIAFLPSTRRRPRPLRAIAIGGAIALVLSLGPQLRVFDQLVSVPLPYALIEKIVPPLAIGGCINRLQVGMAAPLSLCLGFATGLLWRRRAKSGRLAAVFLVGLTIAEYAPRSPGFAEWPFLPPDKAMVAIRESLEPGVVLDTDRGLPALVRQLRHGRPQTYGYLSRSPAAQLGLRESDPAIASVMGSASPLLVGPRLALHLAGNWGIGFVAMSDTPSARERAALLGLEPFSEDPGRSLAFRLPYVERLRMPLPAANIAAESGLLAQGIFGPETIPVEGALTAGCWTAETFSLGFSTRPGTVVLDLAALGRGTAPSPLRVQVGASSFTTYVRGRTALSIPVDGQGLGPRGIVNVRVSLPALTAPPDPRTLGVFLIAVDHR